MIRRQEGNVSKLKFSVPVAILFLAATAAVGAQDGGCVDSPENPTLVFGLIAAVVSLALMWLRGRKINRNQ
jgi:XrtJ-associated TM-motif-TM protein